VERMGDERKVYHSFGGKGRRKETTRMTCVGGRMGSKWILGRLAGQMWSGFTWLRIGTDGELL
jgi:hypothetical protein